MTTPTTILFSCSSRWHWRTRTRLRASAGKSIRGLILHYTFHAAHFQSLKTPRRINHGNILDGTNRRFNFMVGAVIVLVVLVMVVVVATAAVVPIPIPVAGTARADEEQWPFTINTTMLVARYHNRRHHHGKPGSANQ